MRIIGALTLVLGLAMASPGPGWASNWGGLEPGVTTQEQVRERYGAPSQETKQKTEGYDTTTWVYEGSKAPVGMNRMIIDLGILRPEGYKPELVRVFVLEPRPTIFPLQAVMDGWGMPTAAGDQSGFPTMMYEEGLIVVFDKQGQWAESMTFTVPQTFQPPTAGAPPATPGAATQSPTPRAPAPGSASPRPPASPAAPRP